MAAWQFYANLFCNLFLSIFRYSVYARCFLVKKISTKMLVEGC